MRTTTTLLFVSFLLGACGGSTRDDVRPQELLLLDPELLRVVLSREDVYPKKVGEVEISSLSRPSTSKPSSGPARSSTWCCLARSSRRTAR